MIQWYSSFKFLKLFKGEIPTCWMKDLQYYAWNWMKLWGHLSRISLIGASHFIKTRSTRQSRIMSDVWHNPERIFWYFGSSCWLFILLYPLIWCQKCPDFIQWCNLKLLKFLCKCLDDYRQTHRRPNVDAPCGIIVVQMEFWGRL